MKKLSLVKLDPTLGEDAVKQYAKLFGCDIDATFIYLGDIVQMPGHAIIVGHRTSNPKKRPKFEGKIFSGFHTENFVDLTDEEA